MAKRRIRRVASRAYSSGRKLAGGAKGTAIEGVSGAVGYLAHKTASQNIGVIGRNWWSGPAILLGLGHILKRKGKLAQTGAALCGAAGYAAAFAYDGRRMQQQHGGTQGYDVGALVHSAPNQALPDAERVSPMSASAFVSEPVDEEVEADVSAAFGL